MGGAIPFHVCDVTAPASLLDTPTIPSTHSSMESPLKRVLDYKLVFDSLCDSNGMVRLETLTARWPTSEVSGPGKIFISLLVSESKLNLSFFCLA